jgi:hypothetical protein
METIRFSETSEHLIFLSNSDSVRSSSRCFCTWNVESTKLERHHRTGYVTLIIRHASGVYGQLNSWTVEQLNSWTVEPLNWWTVAYWRESVKKKLNLVNRMWHYRFVWLMRLAVQPADSWQWRMDSFNGMPDASLWRSHRYGLTGAEPVTCDPSPYPCSVLRIIQTTLTGFTGRYYPLYITTQIVKEWAAAACWRS